MPIRDGISRNAHGPRVLHAEASRPWLPARPLDARHAPEGGGIAGTRAEGRSGYAVRHIRQSVQRRLPPGSRQAHQRGGQGPPPPPDGITSTGCCSVDDGEAAFAGVALQRIHARGPVSRPADVERGSGGIQRGRGARRGHLRKQAVPTRAQGSRRHQGTSIPGSVTGRVTSASGPYRVRLDRLRTPYVSPVPIRACEHA